jgi:hypothetical protein
VTETLTLSARSGNPAISTTGVPVVPVFVAEFVRML